MAKKELSRTAGTDQSVRDREYLVSPGSDLGDVLRELAELELEFAQSQMIASPADKAHSIHQCRRAIKRLRALLRIGRAIDGVDPRPVDRLLRDGARVLAPIRDATESAGTLGRLLDRYVWLRSLEGIEKVSPGRIDSGISSDAALDKLRKAPPKLADVFADADRWTLAHVASGIALTYERAQKHMESFLRRHSDIAAHEWRKDVQRLGNQLRLIRSLCPECLSAMRQPLSELAGLLGEHNDLSVLHSMVRARRKDLPKKTRRVLLDVVRGEQKLLSSHALTVGFAVFAISPREFREMLIREASDVPAQSA